ncbi:MAG: PIN domain-containing protein [Chthoniobacterales bacterium]|nr:PIN domain-containing protein [Chthoniobacterales bacterium]
MKYLLDTNACIVHLRSKGKSIVSSRIISAGNDIAVSAIVCEELFYGALRTPSPTKSLADVKAFLSKFRSLPFDDIAAEHCARIRSQLDRAGERIQINDVMIAAVALAHGLTLVTHNVRHLGRVPGLSIEDWQSD